jgi:hypothetical protein
LDFCLGLAFDFYLFVVVILGLLGNNAIIIVIVFHVTHEIINISDLASFTAGCLIFVWFVTRAKVKSDATKRDQEHKLQPPVTTKQPLPKEEGGATERPRLPTQSDAAESDVGWLLFDPT